MKPMNGLCVLRVLVCLPSEMMVRILTLLSQAWPRQSTQSATSPKWALAAIAILSRRTSGMSKQPTKAMRGQSTASP